MRGTGGAAHWDDVHAGGDETRSWYQQQAVMSLRMLGTAGVTPADSVIDVGGGASVLAGTLLERGFGDVTVLDISAAALSYARERLGRRSSAVHWLTEDLLRWKPARTWQVWHDRAVFHFLTTPADQDRYLRATEAATRPGAVAVLGCFAPDGPEYCSGLPVARYSAWELADRFEGWTLISADREEHRTPDGTAQPFTWVALARNR